MKIKELFEITRLSKTDYTGGREELENYIWYKAKLSKKLIKPLPGGSGFVYSVKKSADAMIIKIWDPKVKGKIDVGMLIGELALKRKYDFPIEDTYQVDYVTIDEDYRGQHLGKSLYGIALSILKLTLLAGSSQTPISRTNWASLSKIPGVEIIGYTSIDPDELNAKDIDTIMSKLGGLTLGKQSGSGDYYIGFEVAPNTKKNELASIFKSKFNTIYKDNFRWSARNDSFVGLLAHWVG